MADLLIRNLEPSAIKLLKIRAKLHHRSLQGELKFIVEAAIKIPLEEARKSSSKWQKRLAGGTFTDSAELLRKDRDR